MRVVVVTDKTKRTLVKFTLNSIGEIVVSPDLNIDELIVRVVNIDNIEMIDSDYFVIYKEGNENGRRTNQKTEEKV